jgi:hypothetical protein
LLRNLARGSERSWHGEDDAPHRRSPVRGRWHLARHALPRADRGVHLEHQPVLWLGRLERGRRRSFYGHRFCRSLDHFDRAASLRFRPGHSCRVGQFHNSSAHQRANHGLAQPVTRQQRLIAKIVQRLTEGAMSGQMPDDAVVYGLAGRMQTTQCS